MDGMTVCAQQSRVISSRKQQCGSTLFLHAFCDVTLVYVLLFVYSAVLGVDTAESFVRIKPRSPCQSC